MSPLSQSEETLLRKTPLQAIRPRTLDKISNRLDQKKCLLHDDGSFFRDWRGLLAFAELEMDDEQSILSKKESFTTRIVILWSRKPGTCVFSLFQALQCMDRLDVLQDYASSILEDCLSLQSNESPQGIDQALTLHDLEALSRNEPLTIYDAIVLFGDSNLDVKFGMHVVERLESAGKKVFLYDRDLIIGAIEQEAAMRIVRARCRKVIAILTPTFHQNKKSLFLTSYALHLQNESEKMTRIIPVIYSSNYLESEVMKNIAMYSKLKYDKTNTYFWKKLLAGLGLLAPHPELLQMSFPMPQDFDASNLEKTVASTSNPSISIEVPGIRASAVALDLPTIPSSPTDDNSAESINSQTALILPNTPSEDPSSSPSMLRSKPKKKHKILRAPKWLSSRLSN
eukprot:TRINITY_DN6306_c0_g1_i1.p1 TRINITY_DN6306_c0_g1~~TRINITY_DN6306_c0_g1_i1.p1  ORF type:complete len:398 (-),score=96.98 TRINITY_DN6306_c0_g1_i1:37-1230(-)